MTSADSLIPHLPGSSSSTSPGARCRPPAPAGPTPLICQASLAHISVDEIEPNCTSDSDPQKEAQQDAHSEQPGRTRSSRVTRMRHTCHVRQGVADAWGIKCPQTSSQRSGIDRQRRKCAAGVSRSEALMVQAKRLCCPRKNCHTPSMRTHARLAHDTEEGAMPAKQCASMAMIGW